MLFMALGTVLTPPSTIDHSTTAAWLQPMVNSGFLHSAFLDRHHGRVYLVVAAEDLQSVEQRLQALPVVRAGDVSFEVNPVEAL